MYVYHASQQKNLTSIKPMPTKSGDVYIGDFVFATKNKRLAYMYLIPTGIPTLMWPDDSKPWVVMQIEKKKFLDKDNGGAVYVLDVSNFTQTPQQDLTDFELVATVPQKPMNVEVVQSTLETLRKNNIQVKFVDERTFERIRTSKNQEQIVNSLSDYNL